MKLYEIKRKLKKESGFFYKFFKKIYKVVKSIKNFYICIREYIKLNGNLKFINLEDKKILFVGIPLHPNLGDQAQYYCIQKWLKENYNDYKVIELPDCLINSNFLNVMNKKIKKVIKEEDIIIFQSGYRTTDVANIKGEYAHRKIINEFCNNKILVLPQTVNFKNEEEKRKSSEAYSKGNHIMFLARDEKSFETAKEIYPECKVEVFPDIVTSLIGKHQYNNNRNGILCCLRRDSEKFYENSDLENMMNVLKEVTPKVERNDTTINIKYNKLHTELENILENTFETFSKYKVVITDRYHGTIFSLISNTPTIVLSSTDHKLSSGVNWFKGIDEFKGYIYYAKTLEEAEELARKLYNNNYEYKLPPYFENNYYSKLKKEFEEV